MQFLVFLELILFFSFISDINCFVIINQCSKSMKISNSKTETNFDINISGNIDSKTSNSLSEGDKIDIDSNQIAPNHFGDVLGGEKGLFTNSELNLNAHEFTPLERIILTANGNLQRIMSAYYSTAVRVEVKYCDADINDANVYDRQVTLEATINNNSNCGNDIVNDSVQRKVFCTATGKVILHSEECVKAIESRKVGVGQLFKHLGILPSFQLINAGHSSDGSLFREYKLISSHMTCHFVEAFKKDFLNEDFLHT